MGWTNKATWGTAREAVEDEARPSADYEIAWHHGNDYIYVEKATGRPCPTHFLTQRDKKGIWVKDVGVLRSASAARKYVAMARKYLEGDGPDDKRKLTLAYIADCEALLANDRERQRLKTLRVGDVAYVSENYVLNGPCRIQSLPNKHRRSYIVIFEKVGKVCSCPPAAFDLDRTFGN